MKRSRLGTGIAGQRLILVGIAALLLSACATTPKDGYSTQVRTAPPPSPISAPVDEPEPPAAVPTRGDAVPGGTSTNAETRFAQGNAAYRTGDLPLAQTRFEQTLSAEPDHARALYNLSMTHLHQAYTSLTRYLAATDVQDRARTRRILEILHAIARGSAQP